MRYQHFFSALLLGLAPLITHAGVGFFSPGGVPQVLIQKTQFGMINASNPSQVEDSLSRASGTPFKVSIDFGPVIAHPMTPSKLKTQYLTKDEQIHIKAFAPEQMSKLREFPPDPELRKEMVPFLDVLARHKANVGDVFLADEPYFNGISKSEMERAGRLVRRELNAKGLAKVKLGVIFAGGMFNREFAHMINLQAGAYVGSIDDYYRKGDPEDKGFQTWQTNIKTGRLSTYDQAGNIYLGGGLPQGFDVVGFDLYLSTMLLDNIHDHTLEWMSTRFPQFGCGQFAQQPMTKIRARLSFFHDGIVLQGDHYRTEDRKLLDAIFECRMGAITAMLKKEAGTLPIKLLMVSESSNNGLLEFNPAGSIKQGQPELLVESRVLDEVKRAQSFYAKNAGAYSVDLMYFTYQNEYDKSIKLNIGGASGMPSVLASIYKFAATP